MPDIIAKHDTGEVIPVDAQPYMTIYDKHGGPDQIYTLVDAALDVRGATVNIMGGDYVTYIGCSLICQALGVSVSTRSESRDSPVGLEYAATATVMGPYGQPVSAMGIFNDRDNELRRDEQWEAMKAKNPNARRPDLLHPRQMSNFAQTLAFNRAVKTAWGFAMMGSRLDGSVGKVLNTVDDAPPGEAARIATASHAQGGGQAPRERAPQRAPAPAPQPPAQRTQAERRTTQRLTMMRQGRSEEQLNEFDIMVAGEDNLAWNATRNIYEVVS